MTLQKKLEPNGVTVSKQSEREMFNLPSVIDVQPMGAKKRGTYML